MRPAAPAIQPVGSRVHVEGRIGHFCCGGVIRLLEAQVVDDSSCARSRA